MCGRYVTVSKLKAIEKRFNITTSQPELYVENANVSIGEYAPVISDQNPTELSFYKFGFTPSWAKKQMYLFNARAEGDHNTANDPRYSGGKGIINKPAFRQAIRSQRCLVIADAYYEGPEKEKLSKPYLVYKNDGERLFAFAGIWDAWKDPTNGEIVHSFAIVTTTSCDATAKIGHHRSPVILPREAESAWLSNDVPLQDITSLLEPVPPNTLNAYPVDAAVKSPKAKGLALLQPTGQRIFAEYDFELYQELQLEGMGMTQARKRKNQ